MTDTGPVQPNPDRDPRPPPGSPAPGNNELLAGTLLLEPEPLWSAPADSGDATARNLVAGAGVAWRLRANSITLVDIGFGIGFGALEAIAAVPVGTDERLRLVGLGYDAEVLARIQDRIRDRRGYLLLLARHRQVHSAWGKTRLYWGDPRRQVMRMRGHADVILLEPLTVAGCIELFTQDFLRRVSARLAPDGVLATPVSSTAVRNALRRVGLHVGRCHEQLPGGGTLAAHDPALIRLPLNADEQLMLSTSLSAVPYRDTTLCWSRTRIHEHREAAVARLCRRRQHQPLHEVPPSP